MSRAAHQQSNLHRMSRITMLMGPCCNSLLADDPKHSIAKQAQPAADATAATCQYNSNTMLNLSD
jgi:hypothetical protein